MGTVMRLPATATLLVFLCPALASASLTIQYNFDPSVSTEHRGVFDAAKAFWETVITGCQDNVSRTVTVTASTFEEAADTNGSITLGSAGPSSATVSGTNHVITSTGSAEFNTHPDAMAYGSFSEDVIRHELGHILGIGTLWTNNNVYTNGTGRFTGANAVAAYNMEFGQTGNFVPVELQGGGGTVDGHWDEGASGAPTVVAGPNMGKSLDNELMTGNSDGGVEYLSDTTLGSLRDIGFTTIPYAVPEPSAMFLLAFGLPLTFSRRRR